MIWQRPTVWDEAVPLVKLEAESVQTHEKSGLTEAFRNVVFTIGNLRVKTDHLVHDTRQQKAKAKWR